MKVENYKTNVKNKQQVMYLLKTLKLHVSDCQINFDHNTSCLSVATSREISELICNVLTQQGYFCEKINVEL